MKNFYAVRAGYHIGVYEHFENAKDQITGYSNAEWRGFDTYKEAQAYIDDDSYDEYTNTKYWVYEDDIFNNCDFAYRCSGGKYCEEFERKSRARRYVLNDYNEYNEWFREDLYYVDDEEDTIYEVYTDGACLRNGQNDAVGGIGVYFGANNPHNHSLRFYDEPITSQRTELAAIRKAYLIIEAMDDDDYYEIYTDSAYAINCLTKWYKTWMKNKWLTSKGNAVANQDLIKDILRIRARKGCRNILGLVKVAAHSDCEGNNEADELAKDACE